MYIDSIKKKQSLCPPAAEVSRQPTLCCCLGIMSGALPHQPEEFLDHVRALPHAHVPSIEEELDEYLMLREVNHLERV